MKRSMIDKEAIVLNVSLKDWEEAVRACGNVLVETGNVERTYVEAMVKNIRDLGPYIIIAPGIALPHARPEDGVHKTGICVVVLREEVSFGPGKEVKVLIGLAAKDNNSHLDLLKIVAEVISSEKSLGQLKNAQSQDEVMGLFNGKEE